MNEMDEVNAIMIELIHTNVTTKSDFEKLLNFIIKNNKNEIGISFLQEHHDTFFNCLKEFCKIGLMINLPIMLNTLKLIDYKIIGHNDDDRNDLVICMLKNVSLFSFY